MSWRGGNLFPFRYSHNEWALRRRAVADLLRLAKDTEWDQNGNVLGYGLTLRPTAHRFEIDDQTLCKWCAFDTLIFLALIGKPARLLPVARRPEPLWS